MSATVSNNYLQIVPNKFIDLFVKMYSNVELAPQLPAIMLWGQPGVGKSQAVHEAGRRLAEKTKRKLHIEVASLLLMNPIDLRGIPTKDTNDAGELVAKWLTPAIFKMDSSKDVVNILFLDEISAAPPSVQASAYQICLDRRVGEHHFPDNCIVIAAGNRTTDKAVAYKMPKPLGNRMTHFEMVASVADWKKWAYNANIDSRIIGFINHDGKYLCNFDPKTDEVAFATPRSWEMVNTYLQLGTTDGGDDIEDYFSCIAGTVGLGIANEFKNYVAVYDKLPDFKTVVMGTLKECPKNCQGHADVMYALTTMLASRITQLSKEVDRTDKNKVTKFHTYLSNVVNFVRTYKNSEFITLFAKDTYNSISDELGAVFMDNDEFSDLIVEIGDTAL